MAKETKENRISRIIAEQEALTKQERESYPEMVIAVLEKATKLGLTIMVERREFILVTNTGIGFYSLDVDYTPAGVEYIYDLEARLDSMEEKIAEEKRRQQLRQTALSKLSKEECEVLGIKG